MTDDTNVQTFKAAASTDSSISLSVDVVAAYVSNNSLPAADLPSLILNVHRAIVELAKGVGANSVVVQPDQIELPTGAQVRKSITPDALISFVDGKSYKTLKRHLGTHGLDPQSYRQRYGLPSDYPMVAPSYAARRSALAKSIGLGRPGGMATVKEQEVSTSSVRKAQARKAG